MARFLTIAMLTARFGEEELHQIAGVGSWNHPQGRSLDLPKLEAAIGHADELVTGYVAARHPWVAEREPEAQPAVLASIAADLARFRLRNEGGNKAQVSDDVRRRYDDGVARLRDIQAGKFDLPMPAGVTTAPAPDGGIGPVLATDAAPRAGRLLEGWL